MHIWGEVSQIDKEIRKLQRKRRHLIESYGVKKVAEALQARREDVEQGYLEVYTTGTGQDVFVHPRSACEGENCCVHNPSDHAMRDMPTHWRDDRGLMERICKH